MLHEEENNHSHTDKEEKGTEDRYSLVPEKAHPTG